MDLGYYFKLAIDKKASDLHLVEGSAPSLRIAGELVKIEGKPIPFGELRYAIFTSLDKDTKERFKEEKDLDLSLEFHENRFRVNLHFQEGRVGLSARLVPIKIPHPEEIDCNETIYKLTHLRDGLIIVAGPSGVGKSTTLAVMIDIINTERRAHIITIEDPIEYQLKGVNQSQTNDSYTFAQGLRSIVRQDPDVIMVGEIRDLETAEIAIQAALTGHLVLSTIHTNDAAGTVPRFLSMGTKPFLLAPALNVMIGQRLVRKVCQECKQEVKPEADVLKRIKDILSSLSKEEMGGIDFDKQKFYVGKGCDACQGIGYKGRIGIYEIMPINEEIEKLILSGKVSEYDMRAVAAKNGMITMVQDGLLKAMDGITSVEEVFRVAEEK